MEIKLWVFTPVSIQWLSRRYPDIKRVIKSSFGSNKLMSHWEWRSMLRKIASYFTLYRLYRAEFSGLAFLLLYRMSCPFPLCWSFSQIYSLRLASFFSSWVYPVHMRLKAKASALWHLSLMCLGKLTTRNKHAMCCYISIYLLLMERR